jgi:Arc/MetJ-type ribon-helix-helix transcriptional regulator
VSVNFTVRIPRQLYERMKEHREVNWSEVIRRAIEEYLRRLEETETSIPSERLVEELLKMGLKPDMLKPLSPEDEERLYRDLRERTWERVRSTIQAQS